MPSDYLNRRRDLLLGAQVDELLGVRNAAPSWRWRTGSATSMPGGGEMFFGEVPSFAEILQVAWSFEQRFNTAGGPCCASVQLNA